MAEHDLFLQFIIVIFAIPIISYCDYTILRQHWESELGVKMPWTAWIVPTFMEVIMFVAGYGIAMMSYPK